MTARFFVVWVASGNESPGPVEATTKNENVSKEINTAICTRMELEYRPVELESILEEWFSGICIGSG